MWGAGPPAGQGAAGSGRQAAPRGRSDVQFEALWGPSCRAQIEGKSSLRLCSMAEPKKKRMEQHALGPAAPPAACRLLPAAATRGRVRSQELQIEGNSPWRRAAQHTQHSWSPGGSHGQVGCPCPAALATAEAHKLPGLAGSGTPGPWCQQRQSATTVEAMTPLRPRTGTESSVAARLACATCRVSRAMLAQRSMCCRAHAAPWLPTHSSPAALGPPPPAHTAGCPLAESQRHASTCMALDAATLFKHLAWQEGEHLGAFLGCQAPEQRRYTDTFRRPRAPAAQAAGRPRRARQAPWRPHQAGRTDPGCRLPLLRQRCGPAWLAAAIGPGCQQRQAASSSNSGTAPE